MEGVLRFCLIGVLVLLPAGTSMAAGRVGGWRDREDILSRMSGVVQYVMRGGLERREGRTVANATGVGRFPNIRVNQDTSGQAQNETSITVDPLDFSHLVGGWNDYRYADTQDVKAGYGYSFDGGLTWADGVLPGYSAYDAQGDPAVAIGLNGRVYYALIAFDRGYYGDNGVYVSVSDDGGQNWGNPVPINVSGYEAFNDKPYIAVDNTDGPYRNNVYVTWTLFGWNYPIYLSRSTDGGTSFQSPVRVSDSDYTQGSIPVVGPGGELYVAWYDYATGNRLKMNTSDDGGVSFGPDVTIQSITPLPSYLNPGFRVNSFPVMAADVTNGPNRGNLYVCWGDYRNGDADIYFCRSTDGGGTWSAAVRVNDDQLSNGKDQWFPWLSVDPSGNVMVMFMDRRNSPGNLDYDVYLARSVDGGSSFEPNLRVTTVSSNPYYGFDGTFLGDYNGLASTIDMSLPLWTDTRNGNEDAYTALIPTAPDNAVVDITLSPDGTTVPQGGTLTGTLVISNPGGSPQDVDPLAEIRLPNGTMMVYSDPATITIPAGGGLTKDMALPVPDYAPVGSYMMKATLYDPVTGGALAMDYFSFQITP